MRSSGLGYEILRRFPASLSEELEALWGAIVDAERGGGVVHCAGTSGVTGCPLCGYMLRNWMPILWVQVE